MHTLNVTIAGLALLFLFVLVSRLINRSGGGAGGARAFIWIWLIVAAANGIFGVMRAGQPALIEIGVFCVVFGVPAIAAWLAARSLGSRN